MESKTFELRDAATFLPVLCVRLDPGNEQDRHLLARAGYGITAGLQDKYVMMMGLAGGRDHAASDPADWGANRTRRVAHQHIATYWDELPSGAVIDVEFILGLSSTPKKSEAEDEPC